MGSCGGATAVRSSHGHHVEFVVELDGVHGARPRHKRGVDPRGLDSRRRPRRTAARTLMAHSAFLRPSSASGDSHRTCRLFLPPGRDAADRCVLTRDGLVSVDTVTVGVTGRRNGKSPRRGNGAGCRAPLHAVRRQRLAFAVLPTLPRKGGKAECRDDGSHRGVEEDDRRVPAASGTARGSISASGWCGRRIGRPGSRDGRGCAGQRRRGGCRRAGCGRSGRRD
mmetsp:Transcript_8849/g.26727  ORF Transcript_8849/g.26727 Transcript_8849/m.26727 type:complete len:224 (-) Transcript_8849:179-850(-)